MIAFLSGGLPCSPATPDLQARSAAWKILHDLEAPERRSALSPSHGSPERKSGPHKAKPVLGND